MKKTSRRQKERAALVERSDPATVDEEGYERTSSAADVLFTLEAEATVDPEQGGRWRVKAVGRAPADSLLGRALAALLLMAGTAFAMGWAGDRFVKVPWIVGGMMILGLGGGFWIFCRLTGRRRRQPAGSDSGTAS